MKKFTLINTVQLIGMSLIAFSVIGGLTFKVSSPSSSVLSETTANINMLVTYGSKNLSEKPLGENGFPSFDGGAAAFKLEITPAAPEGSTVTITTSDDCVLFSDGKGGGTFNQSKTDAINALYILAVGAVDDVEYEGDHTCKVTASFTSTSSAINGQQRYITFTIKDNDPKPENEIEDKTENSTDITTDDQNNRPGTPLAKLVDDDGVEINNEDSKALFAEGEKITIAGTTVAEGEVKLYIYSEPKQASVVAGEDGAWSYTIEDIEPGEHRVEAEVTDPATGATSEREQVLAFEVAQAEATESPTETTEVPVTSQTENSSTGLLVAVGASIAILTMSLIGLIIYKKKHPHNENDYSSESINPSDGHGLWPLIS